MPESDRKTLSNQPAAGETPGPDSQATVAPQTPGSGRRSLADMPEVFGRYRILKQLGKGGMGAVYLAHDTQLERQVALKVPHFSSDDGPEVLERFYREARAAATLHHPNICPIFDVGAIEGTHYLTMAYIEGKPLNDFIRGDKGVPAAQAAALLRKIALALDEAHRHGIVHRDLKPANIMINQRKEPVIMDFGLARRADKQEARITKSGAVVGTPAYMSPEQVNGKEAGPPSDLYSLGVILYEMLTGTLPFDGPMMAVLSQILLDQPKPPSEHRPDLDKKLEAICLKAMAKDPRDRYASMAEFAAALAQFLRGVTGGAAAATIAPPTETQAKPPAPTPKPAPDLKKTGSMKPVAGSTTKAPAWEEIAVEEEKPSSKPKNRAKPKAKSLWQKPWPYVGIGGAVALILAIVLLSGVIFRVQTKNGVVVLNISEPGAQVFVDDELKITLTSPSEKEPIKIEVPEGKHVMKIVKGGFVTETKEFTLRAGTPQEIRVTLRPDTAAPVGNKENPPIKERLALRPGGLGGRYSPAREQLLRDGGGTAETEAAVERGLRWILRQQQADGSWVFGGYDLEHGAKDRAITATALALLPFFGVGQTHQEGASAAQLGNGLKYLLSKQGKDGIFGGPGYDQGICSMALCEAYALTKDLELKEPAQRAIDFIVRAQHPDGGWRYNPGQAGDISATSWPFIALKTAELAGLSVPKDALDRVSRFLDEMELSDGSGYRYEKNSQGGAATCAIGLLGRLHMGWEPRHLKIRKGLETLNQNPPDPALQNVYYYYYATQAMRHVGGASWKSWEPKMRDWLLTRQETGLLANKPGIKDPDPLAGSWSPLRDAYGKTGGRLFVTSLALLTLQTYYRHVSLYPTESAPSDWTPLFNGKDLTGWVVDSGNPKGWSVENGALIADGVAAGQGWLLTELSFKDFLLRFDYQTAAQGNSGVTFRAAPKAKHAEIQILDDSDPKYAKAPPMMRTGSLWYRVIDQPANLKPLGQWNTMEVQVQGRNLRVSVNGAETVRTHLDRHVAQLPALTNPSGRIGLQNWNGGEVRFRNIEVKDLAPTAGATRNSAPEFSVLRELPSRKIYNNGPWLSPDGMTLYWSSRQVGEQPNPWIWSVQRQDKDSPFDTPQKHVQGSDPTVTGDGLEMIFLKGPDLYSATRKSTGEAFTVPSKIAELQGLSFLAGPCLTKDGLTLYTDQIDKGARIVRFTRATRQTPWGKPQAVTFIGAPDMTMRFFFLTDDGLRAFTTLSDLVDDPGPARNSVITWTRKELNEPFGSPKIIQIPGQTVRGNFPRYVESTSELFLRGPRNAQNEADILVIRNFDPALHVQALPASLVPAAISPNGWLKLDPTIVKPWALGKSLAGGPASAERDGVLTLDNAAIDFVDGQGKVVGRAARNSVIRAKLKYLEGQNTGVSLRSQPAGGGNYYAYLTSQNMNEFAVALGVASRDAKGQATFTELKKVQRKNNSNDFLEVEFSAVGDLLTVHVGGEKLIEVRDGTHATGWAGLNAFNARGFFRDIEWKALD